MANNWPTKDGTCIRDYIHVMDLAEAHIKVFDLLSNERPAISIQILELELELPFLNWLKYLKK